MLDDKIMDIPQELLILGAAVKTGIIEAMRKKTTYTGVDMIRGTNPFAAVFGVNMLINTANGGTWTLDQYTDWLAGSGFEDVKLSEIAGRQIITAVINSQP